MLKTQGETILGRVGSSFLCAPLCQMTFLAYDGGANVCDILSSIVAFAKWEVATCCLVLFILNIITFMSNRVILHQNHCLVEPAMHHSALPSYQCQWACSWRGQRLQSPVHYGLGPTQWSAGQRWTHWNWLTASRFLYWRHRWSLVRLCGFWVEFSRCSTEKKVSFAGCYIRGVTVRGRSTWWDVLLPSQSKFPFRLTAALRCSTDKCPVLGPKSTTQHFFCYWWPCWHMRCF